MHDPHHYVLLEIGGVPMSEIIPIDTQVKYDNDLNRVLIGKLNKTGQNFLMALMARVKNHGSKNIVLTFSEIKKLSKYKSTSTDRFIVDLREMNHELSSLVFSAESQNMLVDFSLFVTFKINLLEKNLTVRVNPDFEYILNNFQETFTSFELEDFVSIRSKYTKSLFRLLSNNNSTGSLKLSIEEFRTLLDIPTSYRNNSINERIIYPSLEILSEYFDNLNLDKILEPETHKILGYHFTFTPKTVLNLE